MHRIPGGRWPDLPMVPITTDPGACLIHLYQGLPSSTCHDDITHWPAGVPAQVQTHDHRVITYSPTPRAAQVRCQGQDTQPVPLKGLQTTTLPLGCNFRLGTFNALNSALPYMSVEDRVHIDDLQGVMALLNLTTDAQPTLLEEEIEALRESHNLHLQGQQATLAQLRQLRQHPLTTWANINSGWLSGAAVLTLITCLAAAVTLGLVYQARRRWRHRHQRRQQREHQRQLQTLAELEQAHRV